MSASFSRESGIWVGTGQNPVSLPADEGEIEPHQRDCGLAPYRRNDALLDIMPKVRDLLLRSKHITD